MKHTEHLNEQQLLDAAVTELARVTGLPLVFGGYRSGESVTVTALAGNRTPSLQSLRVTTGRGLGGMALAELRPRFTADYGSSQIITHDYDREVLDEGVVSLFAIPVVISGEARAVLYGGSHSREPLARVLQQSVSEIADSFAHEIRVRDEVKRRSEHTALSLQQRMSAADREELRAGYAELRSIASGITDPEIRDRLTALEARLTALSDGTPAQAPEPSAIKLTPRELDVLAQVALGATNAEVGQSLGLTEGTVKTYLKTACAKLGSSNRHAAVATARRERLLP